METRSLAESCCNEVSNPPSGRPGVMPRGRGGLTVGKVRHHLQGPLITEGWQSGRLHRFRKPAGVCASPGFKSLTFRQNFYREMQGRGVRGAG